MITLDNGTLSFAFPGIARTLETLIELYIERMLPSMTTPEARKGLIEKLEKLWPYHRKSAADWASMIEKAASLTNAEIEEALRKTTLEKAGMLNGRQPSLSISFVRTLRIPDDGKLYPLPAGLGAFPLRPVDDFPNTTPQHWLKHGGIMMPMYQSEALWLHFSATYPVALKVAAGKINAISGEAWNPGLRRRPQNYVIVPEQPWLDGFAVTKGVIRQFVATPLGAGYSVEEQLTGKADVGGMQLQAFPMRAEYYFLHHLTESLPKCLADLFSHWFDGFIEDTSLLSQ